MRLTAVEFNDGNETVQDPCAVGYWNIVLTGIECSSKLIEGHIRRGADVGGEYQEMEGAHTVN